MSRHLEQLAAMFHSRCFRLKSSVLLAAALLTPLSLWSQEAAITPALQNPADATKPAGSAPAESLPPKPATKPVLPNAAERLAPPPNAQAFKFTNVDL